MKNLIWSLLACTFLFTSCDSKKNEVEPETGFSKIVGSNKYAGRFYPWDVKETEDEGFIALSSSNSSAFKNILITKIDKTGELEWEIADSSTFVNPVGEIFEQNGSYFIFAMQQVTLNTHLLRINLANRTLEDVQAYANFLYPISASKVPGGFLLQCFDRDAERIRIMKLNSSFNEEWRERYSVFEDPEEFNSHLTLENRLPFFCGYVGGENNASHYYFGGMYNFTLTTAFINISDGALVKRMAGFRYEAGVSNLLHLNESNFFLTKYNVSKEASLLRNLEIDITSGGILNAQNDLPENVDFEISSDARNILKKITLNDRNLIVHATESKNQETILNFYNQQGTQVANKRIGSDSAYLLGNLTPTTDGGLMVLCHTFIAGRLSRLVFIKIPKTEIEALI